MGDHDHFHVYIILDIVLDIIYFSLEIAFMVDNQLLKNHCNFRPKWRLQPTVGPWYLYRVWVMMLIGPLSQLLLWLQTETQTMAGYQLELSTNLHKVFTVPRARLV